MCCTGHSENHQLFDINTNQNSCLSRTPQEIKKREGRGRQGREGKDN